MNEGDTGFKLDFIGIGAAKSATTWLADILRLHPQIFIPGKKELNYFNEYWLYYNKEVPNLNCRRPTTWYHSFFKEAKLTQLKGEFSVSYLPMEEVPSRIFRYNPGVKLMVILRNPVHQVHSLYLFLKQKGFIHHPDFRTAICQKRELLECSRYCESLKRYFAIFPRENIKVLLYDLLIQDTREFLAEVYGFLGVDLFYPPTLGKRSNVTQESRFPKVNYAIDRLRVLLHKRGLQFLLPTLKRTGITPLAEHIRDKLNVKALETRPSLDAATEAEVRSYFIDDIENLEKLLKVDLSHWK